MIRKVLRNGFVKFINVLGKDVIRDKSNIIFQFEIKCPVFVAKILEGFKTGSFTKTYNDEFYVPSFYFKQDGTPFTEQENNELYSKFENYNNWCYNFYRKLLSKNLSKSQTSMIQPQNMFVQFYWTVDLRTCLYFIKQQQNSSYEVRQYSNTIFKFLRETLPDMNELFDNE